MDALIIINFPCMESAILSSSLEKGEKNQCIISYQTVYFYTPSTQFFLHDNVAPIKSYHFLNFL